MLKNQKKRHCAKSVVISRRAFYLGLSPSVVHAEETMGLMALSALRGPSPALPFRNRIGNHLQ